MATLTMTMQDFKDKIFDFEQEQEWKFKGKLPVIIDFYADWCGPCKMVAPIMDELARSRLGTVLVAKMDTDRNQQTAQRFQIASIPTVMVFKGGAPVARQVGALPRPGYEALIDKAMN